MTKISKLAPSRRTSLAHWPGMMLAAALMLIINAMGSNNASAQSQVQLVHQTNTTWSYHPNLVDPGYAPADAWTARTFDDSSWATGKGYFGTETTPGSTYNPGAGLNHNCNCFSGTVIAPPQSGAGPSSSYFRTHFNWAGGTNGVVFNFTNWVDDSVVVYLNGNLLFSFNFSAGKTFPIAWNDFNPSGTANPLGEGVDIVTNVPATGLIVGDNVLSAQLNQQANTSSDDVFTMALWALIPQPIVITQQPTNTTSLENRALDLVVVASGTAPTYQWYKGTNPPAALVGATNAAYHIANTTPADTGNYFVVVSNFLNVVTSTVVRLTVSNDTNSPVLLSVKGEESFTKIILNWDELIDPGAATEIGNYYIFDPMGNQVTVNSIDFGGNIVTLHVPTLIPNTNYSIEVDFQADVANNRTKPVGVGIGGDPDAIVTNLQSWVYSPGLTFFQAYLNRTANESIATFVGTPAYPTGSTFSFHTNQLYWPQSQPGNGYEQYVMRFSGFFVAPEDGLYHFNPAHDDEVRLRVYPDTSTNGTPTELAVACCTGLLDGPSVDVTLTAGNRYYYELIVHEFGGGDYAGVSVILPSGGTNSPISAQYLSIAADPATAPNVGFAQQPQNQTAQINHFATFSVVVTNFGSGISFQWQRDAGTGFTNVPLANDASYSTPLLTLANSGEHYRVIANVPARTITSSSALLTVVNDTNAPHVTNVVAGQALASIVVSFDEVMDGTMLGNLAKYGLTGSNNTAVPLSAPVVAADNRSVSFTTPALTIGATYTLHAQDVPDAAGNPLAPVDFVFQTGRGFILFEAYDTSSTAGNTVALLTAHPNYPNNPRERLLMPSFDSRNVYPNDSHEQYGARISGWFVAPATTNYIFYLRSDDSSELRLSTNNSPTNKVLIQQDTGCCNAFSLHPSLPKALEAGKAYYIEMLYKEGTGGDFGQVAVKTAGDPVNPDALLPISGSFLNAVDPTVPTPANPTLRSSVSGGSITFSWDAPARLQFTRSLSAPIVWEDVNTGGATTFTVTPSNEFNVSLNAAQEVPVNASTGTGGGTVSLSNNVLKVNVTYTNLAGNRTADHFHAPAGRGTNAAVVYNLAGLTTGTTSGTIVGDVPLVDGQYGGKNAAAQAQDIRNSQWYLNIHTSTFGGGEIRGQVELGTRFYRLTSP